MKWATGVNIIPTPNMSEANMNLKNITHKLLLPLLLLSLSLQVFGNNEMLNELTAEANQGDAEAQFKLGYMYKSGEKIPKNYPQALHWYTKAAEQGNVRAQYNLAVMYNGGQEIPQDYPQALHWYTKAAEQGHTNAQFNLGVMYYNGQGTPRNLKQAYIWLALATDASQGYQDTRDKIAKALTESELNEAQQEAEKLRKKIKAKK